MLAGQSMEFDRPERPVIQQQASYRPPRPSIHWRICSRLGVLGFTEPEILYPSGAELLVELTAPLITSEVFPSNIPQVARTPEEREQMLRFVRALPFRTATHAGNKASDLTNLLFLGPPEAVRRALDPLRKHTH